MIKPNQQPNRKRHEFLLTFFKKNEEVKEVNGYVLKKYFSNNTHQWEVAIYTKESYARAEDYLQAQSHLASIKQQNPLD